MNGVESGKFYAVDGDVILFIYGGSTEFSWLMGAYKMIYETDQAEYSRRIQYARLTVATGVEDIMVTV